MGITHILNAGHNTTVFTGPNFYTGMEIHYMGVEVDDFPECDISKFFRPAAEFLDEALLTYRGKVLVNSEMGMSRSAILVAAYLMIFHHMTILEALMTLRKKRAIYPNDSFIMQLRELNEKLLEEREYSDGGDDNDTNSQGSVKEAKAHSILVEEEGDRESIMGAKVHSITVEQEDTTSIMGSAMSLGAKSSVVSKQPTLIDEDEEEKIYEEWRRKQGLPPREIPKKENEQSIKLPEEEVSDDQLRQMIYNWQKENAKYHSLDPGDDGNSMMREKCYSPSEISDVESVSSQEIRMLKEQFEVSRRNLMTRQRTDSVSTDSTWDMWNQRLMEIEKEAITKSDEKEKKREKDIDEESLCSEASSLFNFCKKNKHKLTALERWKVKRIQFGFHKKDSEASDTQNKEDNGEKKDEDQTSQSDVDISAYQAWKMKHQKKVGNENKEEIVELTKGEDTASIKRKQRRAEILERSKQTLEESQSICGWDNESSISGSIPLSALFQIAPSSSGGNDAASVLSMQSNKSHQSQARSAVSQAKVLPPNLPPGADAISIAGIQNWIANVVNETIAQKQNEIMMMSRASSSMSMASGDLGRRADDERSSILGAAGGSCLSGSGFQQRDFKSSDSVLSNTSVNSATNIPSAKRKITQTSVPLFGLFMDDVDLKKLNQKENEIREELTEKLTQYRKEKVVTDNKRSYMYRKKKAKGTEEDEEEEKESILSSKFQSSRLSSNQEWKKSEKTSYLSNLGNLSSTKPTSTDVETNVGKWLSGVNTERASKFHNEKSYERSRQSEHERYVSPQVNGYTKKSSEWDKEGSSSYQSYRDTTRATSRFSMSSEEEYDRVRHTNVYESQSPEPNLSDHSKEENGLEDLPSAIQPRRSYLDHEDSDISDTVDSDSKRKFTGRFKNDEDEKSDPLESNSSGSRWARNRKTKEETEEMDDDDIIAAWRSRQEEMKTRLRRHKEED
ncbi:serine/threonine/tyrosine-interacting-like protein 2 isoform X2 [Bufo bufo]|nr:serine/threonine/tyrosine-interacting-like protein 2 isoform X2 [Bufo bufo]